MTWTEVMYPVPCRECHAAAGEACRTGSGRPRSLAHAIREKDQAKAATVRERSEVDLAHSVPCSYCQAPAGSPCKTALDTIDRSQNPHSVRIQAGRKQAKKAGDPNQGALL